MLTPSAGSLRLSRMPKIVAFFGHQQVGKSTASQALVDHGFVRCSFAEPIYSMLSTLLGISQEEIRSLPKEAPMPGLGGQTLRRALQTLGTEWGRDTMSNNLWALALERRVDRLVTNGHNVVIDDLRFLNEYATLERLGARFVKIERPGFEGNGEAHGSEVEWKRFKVDHTLINSGLEHEWKTVTVNECA